MYGSPVYQFYNNLHETHTLQGTEQHGIIGGPLRSGFRSKAPRGASRLNIQQDVILNTVSKPGDKIAWIDANNYNSLDKRMPIIGKDENLQQEMALPGSPMPYEAMAEKTRGIFESQKMRLARVELLLCKAKSEVHVSRFLKYFI